MREIPKCSLLLMEEAPGRELLAVARAQYFLWSSPFKLQVEPCAPKGKAQASAQEKNIEHGYCGGAGAGKKNPERKQRNAARGPAGQVRKGAGAGKGRLGQPAEGLSFCAGML